MAEETGTPIYAWALMSNHVHILLCSGALGLAKFMRRLLTGYAVSYNLRHRRHGHVFQNRYKSIVGDGDSYFKFRGRVLNFAIVICVTLPPKPLP
ncbi:MAG TPA: transposase [Candidatus Binatia bacterium]